MRAEVSEDKAIASAEGALGLDTSEGADDIAIEAALDYFSYVHAGDNPLQWKIEVEIRGDGSVRKGMVLVDARPGEVLLANPLT